MKKIYLALMCMASLSMMTACGGDKKGDKGADAEGEETEVVSEDEQNADEQEASEQTADQPDVWGDPANAEVLNLAALYEAGDFKPAMTTIFEDTLGGQSAGELPEKWDIRSGSAEVGNADGVKYITMLGGDTNLLPLVGDNSKNYLPEKYTLEFQLMFGYDVWYHVNFYDAEENGIGDFNMWVGHAEWNMAKTDDEWMHGEKGELYELINRDGWNHFAASYDKGNLRFFINGKRIANMPNIKQAAYFTITGDGADGRSHFIRNIRVAK
jgi:hypothetical protein